MVEQSRQPEEKPRWVRTVVILTVLALMAPIAIVARSWRVSEVGSVRGLTVDEDALDFGEVWAQEDFIWVLPIMNTSKHDLTVEEFVPSCGCGIKEVQPASLTVAAGQTAEVRLTINLTNGVTDASAGMVRDVELKLAFRLAEGPPPEPITVRGRVRDAFRPEASIIQYGESLREGTAFAARRLSIREIVPLKELRARCVAELGTVRIDTNASGSAEAAEFQRTMTFIPSAGLRAGPLAGSIELLGVTQKGEELPPLRVEVRGNVMPEIYPLPRRLDLGIRPVGEIAQETVVLQSAGGKPFEVDEVKLPDANEARNGLTIESELSAGRSGSHLVEVSLQFQRPGRYSAKLCVFVRNAEGQRKQVTIPISAYVPSADGGVGNARETGTQ